MNEKFESSKFNSWEMNKKNMISELEERKNDVNEEEDVFDDKGKLHILTKNKISFYEIRLEDKDVVVDPTNSLEQLKMNRTAYLVDIRSEPETIFNGKPDLTESGKPIISIPYKLYPSMRENPQFKETYKKYIFDKESTAFLLCKDGKISEKAANEIREFHGKCYSIKNGFDGERDDLQKKRGNINGWKAEGLPWEEY
jgi:rhodanese-related sulfurtransferase